MAKPRKPTRFAESDKVVCVRAIEAVECFEPVPQVGRVYCVRSVENARNSHAIRLVGVRGVYEGGEEVRLCPRKFRLLSEVQAGNRSKGGRP